MKPFNSVVCLLLILSILSGTLLAQQPSKPEFPLAQIAGTILVEGHSLKYLRELADGFGGRLSGTDAYDRSAAWAMEQFRAAGIDDVKLEPFTLQHTWERVSAHARLLAPLKRPLQVHSYGWTPSTPPGGVIGEVVYVPDFFSQDKLKAQADRLKNRIVLIDGASFPQNDEDFLDSRFNASKRFLKEVGALALVVQGSTANNVTTSYSDQWDAILELLPIAAIGMEDGKFLRRLLEKEVVRMELTCDNLSGGPVQSHNVVAQIRGREKPEEWIVIGAHLDSWDQGTGAQDNGTGCAMVLEAARAIARSKMAPRRSIRFALWGAEEQGLIGSRAYVRTHAAEMKSCVAALNTDLGAGHPKGWTVRGTQALKKAMSPMSQSLTDLGGNGLKVEVKLDQMSDWGTFLLEGVPTLDLWVDLTHYFEIHHKASDTVDKIDPHSLAVGAAVTAVTAYGIADQPERLAPHLTKTEVDAVLKEGGAYEFIQDLKSSGVWK